MKKILLGIVFLFFTLSTFASVAEKNTTMDCANNKGEMKKYSLYRIEINTINETNKERVKHGLLPLIPSIKLIEGSRHHAIWMTNKSVLRHGVGNFGENIAMGYKSSVSVVRGWMNSSGHRKNILSRSYRHIGVSAYVNKRTGVIWWCQRFK